MIPKETKVFYNETESRNLSLDYSLLYVNKPRVIEIAMVSDEW
jgi:hypothetical protein